MQPLIASLSAEEIASNWNRYVSLLKKTGDRAEPISKMLEHFEERLLITPASAKKSFHNCFPGGLVDHSLRVLKNAIAIKNAFEWNLPKDSLIIGCLFHDIGKAGDLEHDYYVQNESSWHIENRGELYTINPQIDYMTVPDRGVWLCQHFGIRLTREETLAIKLNDGQYADENKPYRLKEPMLVDVVHMADLIATKQEKGLLPV